MSKKAPSRLLPRRDIILSFPAQAKHCGSCQDSERLKWQSDILATITFETTLKARVIVLGRRSLHSSRPQRASWFELWASNEYVLNLSLPRRYCLNLVICCIEASHPPGHASSFIGFSLLGDIVEGKPAWHRGSCVRLGPGEAEFESWLTPNADLGTVTIFQPHRVVRIK